MDALREILIPLPWLAWLAAWLLLSRRVKARARREPRSTRLMGLVLLLAAALLLLLPDAAAPLLAGRFVPDADWTYWTGAGLTALGLLFAVQALLLLARDRSAAGDTPHGRALITDGPYALVRHPMYAGLLLAFAGTVLARGELRGLLALALAAVFLRGRMRLEERWMEQEFGDAYREYARRVAALVPFAW